MRLTQDEAISLYKQNHKPKKKELVNGELNEQEKDSVSDLICCWCLLFLMKW